jgi:hypothetical protein
VALSQGRVAMLTKPPRPFQSMRFKASNMPISPQRVVQVHRISLTDFTEHCFQVRFLGFMFGAAGRCTTDPANSFENTAFSRNNHCSQPSPCNWFASPMLRWYSLPRRRMGCTITSSMQIPMSRNNGIRTSRLVARAKQGLENARRNGVRFGPKPKLSAADAAHALELVREGSSYRQAARALDVHHVTIARLAKRSFAGPS